MNDETETRILALDAALALEEHVPTGDVFVLLRDASAIAEWIESGVTAIPALKVN